MRSGERESTKVGASEVGSPLPVGAGFEVVAVGLKAGA